MIDSVIKSEHFDTAQAVIIFECIDGYKPVMDLSKIYDNAKGYIAIKDLDSSVKRNWPDSVEKMFAPYYLVWDDVKKEDNSFVWLVGSGMFRTKRLTIDVTQQHMLAWE